MAQKKAFVRYAQNKAVPGSLIVRTKAPKVGTWKEVPYDICCGGGGCTTPVTVSTPLYGNTSTNSFPTLNCSTVGNLFRTSPSEIVDFPITYEDFVNIMNNGNYWLGTWELGEDELILNINCEIANCLCSNGQFSLIVPA